MRDLAARAVVGRPVETYDVCAFGGEELVREFLTGLPGGFWVQFAIVMAVIFVLGFFLDWIEITLIVLPLMEPVTVSLGIDKLWFGVLFIVNIQIAYLTPPFGFVLFWLKSVLPPDVSMGDVYKSVGPFILLQLLGLALVFMFPEIATWLPNKLK